MNSKSKLHFYKNPARGRGRGRILHFILKKKRSFFNPRFFLIAFEMLAFVRLICLVLIRAESSNQFFGCVHWSNSGTHGLSLHGPESVHFKPLWYMNKLVFKLVRNWTVDLGTMLGLGALTFRAIEKLLITFNSLKLNYWWPVDQRPYQ